MYSFAQRRNTRVVDEPLYGHYLRVTGANHPGRSEILNAMNCNGDDVMRDLLEQQRNDSSTHVFLKHMAHHLVDIDLSILCESNNILLVRSPRDMLPSLTIQLPHAKLADTGLKRQWEIFSRLAENGQPAAVLDSRELLLEPEFVLRKLCDHLLLDFDPCMLAWGEGPRPEDGIWAPHWYHQVHKSTGFSNYVPKTDFPEHLEPLLAECEPWYDKLYAHALRKDTRGVNE